MKFSQHLPAPIFLATRRTSPFALWKKYFSQPSLYAPEYTRGSRNFINLGLGSLIIAVLVYSVSFLFIDFAFSPIPSEENDRFRRHEGELIVMKTGYLQSGFCIALTPPARGGYPCVSPFAPMRGNPGMIGKHAVGYVVPWLGIVDLTLDGTKILDVRASQERLQSDIYRFFGLVAFTVIMFGVAFLRQIYLVADHDAGDNT
jgi:hypothetical protein